MDMVFLLEITLSAQYDKIRFDPDLCFAKRNYKDLMEVDETAEVGVETVSVPPENKDLEKSEQESSKPEDAKNSEAVVVDIESSGPLAAESVNEQAVKVEQNMPDKEATEDAIMSDAKKESTHPSSGEEETETVEWPSASELGVRVRRVLAAFLRFFATEARRRKKKALREEQNQVKKERNRNLTKKERTGTKKTVPANRRFLEFRRVILSFGVEKDEEGKLIWDQFRHLSGVKRADDVLEEYYEKTMSMARECLEMKSAKDKEDSGTSSAIRVDNGGDTMSLEVARRIIKRVEKMDVLRTQILNHPQLDFKIDNLKRHNRSGLPQYVSMLFNRYQSI